MRSRARHPEVIEDAQVYHCMLHRSVLQVALKYTNLDTTTCLQQFLTLSAKTSSWCGKHRIWFTESIDESEAIQEEEQKLFMPIVKRKARNNASPGSEFYGALHSAQLAQLFITKRRGEVWLLPLGNGRFLQSTERRQIQLKRALCQTYRSINSLILEAMVLEPEDSEVTLEVTEKEDIWAYEPWREFDGSIKKAGSQYKMKRNIGIMSFLLCRYTGVSFPFDPRYICCYTKCDSFYRGNIFLHFLNTVWSSYGSKLGQVSFISYTEK